MTPETLSPNRLLNPWTARYAKFMALDLVGGGAIWLHYPVAMVALHGVAIAVRFETGRCASFE